MSRKPDGSRRKSLFSKSSLSLDTGDKKDSGSPNILKKRRTPSLFSSASSPAGDKQGYGLDGDRPASPIRPPFSSLSSRTSGRPSSLFGSLRSMRSSDDIEDPLTAVSSAAPSINWDQDTSSRSRNVLQHGEVQTSSSMFRKKKEYLVLTETHIFRFKSQQKAAEVFSAIHPTTGRTSLPRHSATHSGGSFSDMHSSLSDASGERELGTPLRQIVAVYNIDDGRPWFALEVVLLDDETNQASCMTLQFNEPDDRDFWLASIRSAANQACLVDENPMSAYNTHLAARVVERDGDYDPRNYATYKVVQRPSSKSSGRSSSDDLVKMGATVCFLAVGIHKVHLIPLFKSPQRASSPALISHNAQGSYGILSLTEVRLNRDDDVLDLTFRTPLQRPRTLHLASLASYDIALRIRQVEELLRPDWESRPYKFSVPDTLRRDSTTLSHSHLSNEDYFERTLIGYCIAYGVKPEVIRYQIAYDTEDRPCFELLKPNVARRSQYTVLELLAIMRSLRYNETFGSMSFAGISLNELNGLHDPYGNEHLCSKTKKGTPVNMSAEDLEKACVLVQEIRALAITNKKLRRIDFTSSITRKPPESEDGVKPNDIGCGIVEALFPLCRAQTTNVDWIILNNIQLSDTDLDYLVGAAVERTCHFRALEMSGCGLTDRSLSMVLDALRAQENTLEAIDISRNLARLSPSTFESQISVFGFIRKLNLSYISRTSGPEPLISADTLLLWRLQELSFSGTTVNTTTVDAIACYLQSKQSDPLRLLRLDRTYLTGKDVAVLMHAMTRKPGTARQLHLDVSQNRIEQHHDQFATALASGLAPALLTIKLLEYEDDALFRQFVLALAVNNTISSLDVSRASLPYDASDETCQALERMFAENSTLEHLDISGEYSRLEISKLGVGINRALCGLKRNETLRTLRIQFQKLGLQGASTLADVLKVNSSLRWVHCENNGIPLQGFTDLVNALHRNTTVLYLPDMHESRQEHLRRTEAQIKAIRDEAHASHHGKATAMRSILAGKAAKPSKDRPSTSQLSDQDIRAAMRLVEESWERQTYRLQQYLQRNASIAQGIRVPLDVDEEEFERPDTGRSMSKILEQVKTDRTPTMEKEVSLTDELEKVDEKHPRGSVPVHPALEKSYSEPLLSLDDLYGHSQPSSANASMDIGERQGEVTERGARTPRFELDTD